MNRCSLRLLALALTSPTLTSCGGDDTGPLPECLPERDPTTIDVTLRIRSQLLDQPREQPAWIAVQDGGPECPWQVARDGVVTVTHERYAVAVACLDPSVPPKLALFGRTLADGSAIELACERRLTEPLEQHAHAIQARVGGTTDPIVVQLSMHDDTTDRLELVGGLVATRWFANTGRHDMVSVGHVGLDPTAPDLVKIVRDLEPQFDHDIDVSPASASGYLPFGARVSVVSFGSGLVSASYVTSNGTFVPLGETLAEDGSALLYDRWPDAARDDGDVYLQAKVVAGEIDTQIGQTFSRDPDDTAPGVPDKLSASRIQGGVAFRPHDGATGYQLECVADDRLFVHDLSASWFGDEREYRFPELPADPLVPAVLHSPQCALEMSVYTVTNGLLGAANIDAIGRERGAPAVLDGTFRAIARHRL
jgi:hypothetical protein